MPETESVQISDDDMCRCLSDSIPKSTDVRELWSYSKGTATDWEKTIVWSEARKHRQALSDIFVLSGGRQLTPKPMLKQ
eukprot:4729367-Pyramimonas_sp.AAC.1